MIEKLKLFIKSCLEAKKNKTKENIELNQTAILDKPYVVAAFFTLAGSTLIKFVIAIIYGKNEAFL